MRRECGGVRRGKGVKRGSGGGEGDTVRITSGSSRLSLSARTGQSWHRLLATPALDTFNGRGHLQKTVSQFVAKKS